MPPARYMSCPLSAASSSGPMVGRLSTMAVSVSPEMIAGSSPPTVLMIGLSATRSHPYRVLEQNGALGRGQPPELGAGVHSKDAGEARRAGELQRMPSPASTARESDLGDAFVFPTCATLHTGRRAWPRLQ